MSHRELGTGIGHAAEGYHTHAYASTTHWDALHGPGGSDPADTMGGFLMSPTDGSGTIEWNAQATTPSAPAGDGAAKWYMGWKGFRPIPCVRSIDQEMIWGTTVGGQSGARWQATTQASTTAPAASNGVPTSNTGTWSTPAATTATGYIQQVTTGTTSGNTASVSSTQNRWCRGDQVKPWLGYWYHAIVGYPSAAYTNSRIFNGMTSNSVATMLGADSPNGERHGFRLLNGSGNFLMSQRTGAGTVSDVDSGIALVQNHFYEFFLHTRPGGGYCFGEVRDITAGTTSGSLIDGSGTAPANTTFLLAMVGLVTTNTTAKLMNYYIAGCECSI